MWIPDLEGSLFEVVPGPARMRNPRPAIFLVYLLAATALLLVPGLGETLQPLVAVAVLGGSEMLGDKRMSRYLIGAGGAATMDAIAGRVAPSSPDPPRPSFLGRVKVTAFASNGPRVRDECSIAGMVLPVAPFEIMKHTPQMIEVMPTLGRSGTGPRGTGTCQGLRVPRARRRCAVSWLNLRCSSVVFPCYRLDCRCAVTSVTRESPVHLLRTSGLSKRPTRRICQKRGLLSRGTCCRSGLSGRGNVTLR